MKIMKIKFRNIGSYGNNVSEIDLTGAPSGLHLITGQNGAGKCVDGSTFINIKIDDPAIEMALYKFIKEQKNSKNSERSNLEYSFLSED